jgi:anti-sigma factor RsiW
MVDPREPHGETELYVTQIDEMACNELVEVVTEYLEGTLGADHRRRFEAHLEECPYCVDYVEQFRETIAASGELTLESISEERRAELLDAFRGWRGGAG